VGDDDRDVADETDAALAAVHAQLRPLLREQVLHDLHARDLRRQLARDPRQRRWFAIPHVVGPRRPRRAAVRAAQGLEGRSRMPAARRSRRNGWAIAARLAIPMSAVRRPASRLLQEAP
jgi:hypothetical protein